MGIATADAAAASSSGSSGTPAGAPAETKEAAASVSKEPTSDTVSTAIAGDDSKAVAKVVAETPSKSPSEKVVHEVPADSLTVCVKSISYSVEEDQLELDFGDHGEIEDFVFLEGRGLAFITYASKEGVEAALKMDGDEYWGRKLGVALADKARVPTTEVFEVHVRGLPVAAKEEAVREHFSPCGEIIKCKMRPGKESRDGEAKSSAFIVFKTQEALDSAVKLKGSKFQDDIITVVVADNDDKGKGGKGKGKGKGKDKGKSKGKGKKNSKGKGKGGR